MFGGGRKREPKEGFEVQRVKTDAGILGLVRSRSSISAEFRSCSPILGKPLQHSAPKIEAQMEKEGKTLKVELMRTRDALKIATKKCRDLVRELEERTAEHESERALREQQLSRILRALLVLEARLKQEQKSIRHLLSEKDNVIRNQQLEIAKLRRYTKNYIKSNKRDAVASAATSPATDPATTTTTATAGCLSKDIERLKCEIIDKLNSPKGLERAVKKTDSFAGSDISKTSLTSSENTDGSPSLLSTEGFCEGESTDTSAGSTLDKSNRYTPTTVTDSENEITMVCNDHEDDGDESDEEEDEGDEGDEEGYEEGEEKQQGEEGSRRKFPPRNNERLSAITRIQEYHGKAHSGPSLSTLLRSESTDDGLDCNFLSDNDDAEPIYVNSRLESSARKVARAEDDNNNKNSNVADAAGMGRGSARTITAKEKVSEESSVNWYSDPDEDRISEDVLHSRHASSANFGTSGNHNSVLECVNQILLRDMEEEENSVHAVTRRRLRYRGRSARFQPGKLSDIESVGSEMERRNSEETTPTENEHALPAGSFEATTSEDEFGMKITGPSSTPVQEDAMPIVIIEPKLDTEQSTSSKLLLERSAALNLARNLDYEDIESLPDASSTTPTSTPTPTPIPVPFKTPPALPPKPLRNNTLVLKKIPSPSFLIDETRKRQQLFEGNPIEQGRRIFDLISSPLKRASSSDVKSAARTKLDVESNASEEKEGDKTRIRAEEVAEEEAEEEAGLVMEVEDETMAKEEGQGKSWRSRFKHVRSSFQAPAKVTNIIRQFEEFKIGAESNDNRNRDRNKTLRESQLEIGQELDIGQNFEEFNLDECDFSDDGREEADGSEKLGNLRGASIPTERGKEVASSVSNSSGVTGYDNFLEATGLSNKSILTPSRLLSNHKSMLKPKDVKYKNKIKASAVLEKHGISSSSTGNSLHTHVRHWTGPFV